MRASVTARCARLRRLSHRELALAGWRAPAFRRAAGRFVEVLEDGAFGARGDKRLADSLDVHVGPPPVAAVVALDRNHREDAVGADELAVAERDHANGLVGHLREI